MIIGISGKKGHGKDTVAKIINFISTGGLDTYVSFKGFLKYYNDGLGKYPWENKKFADQIKYITCMILGCTREQLEDSIFKETPLGDEWHCMVLSGTETIDDAKNVITYEYWKRLGIWEQSMYHHRKMTPRLFMQLLGTDFGRNMIHPNIWVNSLMKDYKPFPLKYNVRPGLDVLEYPNWIITDVRFLNEVEAVHKRSGITLRVENPRVSKPENEHPSETALDDYEFPHYLTNSGSIEDMVEPVRDFLKFNKLI